jgi:hypothetical protein
LAKVLGRVTQPLDTARGPDVIHRIAVPAAWFERGATIQLELPRNLACAKCEGGGCDACDRSGAISLRGRDEPPEVVIVTLPTHPSDDDPPSSQRSSRKNTSLVLRIAEQGGLPDPGSDECRGMLLLRIGSADQPDAGVELFEAPEPELEPAQPPRQTAERSLRVTIVAVLVILWIAFLLLLRLSGLG